MAAIETKAKRKPNWTQEECLLLVTLINENKHVLRSRLGPNLTSQMKRDTWEKISKQFNASALTPRTTEEIEKKWNNILSTSKAEISTFRKQSTLTGKLIQFFHIFTSLFPLSHRRLFHNFFSIPLISGMEKNLWNKRLCSIVQKNLYKIIYPPPS